MIEMKKKLSPLGHSLKQRLQSGQNLKFIEAHNGLSCLIASRAQVSVKDEVREFDGIWVSSLTTSAARGLPDMEMYLLENRLDTIREIVDSTEKAVLVDGDTGGEPVAFEYLCQRLERLGVSGIVIEDKRFPKRNSLSEDSNQLLENPIAFCEKIRRGKDACSSSEFLIVARLEGLILGQSIEDTLERAMVYIESGADAILVHSRLSEAGQVFDFAKKYQENFPIKENRKPLICVPTTYNATFAEDLFAAGYSAVIYANHLLRAAHQAMKEVTRSLLLEDRSFESETRCSKVADIFNETGYTAAIARDKEGLAL
ncbi:isocitrate lyase/phosphoenolpyruvate mutase family protein [Chitiniphilus purpureus]|uniref:Isocitrate lyase/phosphoenolpyruvate mutase family protein n=1 Tax=Chitiniphilus purpureus TaxID=2981137 RepID=A0ABY6DN73_9NEIS|nr:isocitrate lyase/phosphoenolpyruvate mutase family protein [Chitiniphilus sp. CD1]UXY15810.1 isocitrate lyase/phosphoenolpyruvate mutase family protein [Chitiniphilus sp. CD1]